MRTETNETGFRYEWECRTGFLVMADGYVSHYPCTAANPHDKCVWVLRGERKGFTPPSPATLVHVATRAGASFHNETVDTFPHVISVIPGQESTIAVGDYEVSIYQRNFARVTIERLEP